MGDVLLSARASIEKSSKDKKLLDRLPNESDKLDDGLLQMRTKKSMSVSRRKMLDCRNLLNDDEATAPTIPLLDRLLNESDKLHDGLLQMLTN
jgi:hypothetical protein